ncbi:hypothetical protein JW916_12020 [Candidatus Sumerlaeota bacterium]|nr:hypothetical protein [Candidatus Sumerlaeota bacterium]
MKATPKEVYLTDVVAFCDFLKENAPRLEAGVALQGLAGLQLQETTRLTWSKVDLSRGLIEISGEVKNEYRKRVIPICGRVVEALRRGEELARKRKPGKIRDAYETVLVRERSGAYGSSWDKYSRHVQA